MIFKSQLGFDDMDISEIQRSHRVGAKRNNPRVTRQNKPNPRPIIVRFSNYKTRYNIFKSKKKLKGKPIAISENLTKRRYELLREATSKLGKGMAWSNEGKIITKQDNRYIIINSISDLDRLSNDQPVNSNAEVTQ